MHKDNPSADDIMNHLPSEIKENPPIDLSAMIAALPEQEDFSGGIASLLD